MKLVIFTIVLDGQPWIEKHLPVFSKLTIPWRWIICEGAAANNGSTKWCKPQISRLSNDGTTEYLCRLRRDPRLTIMQRPLWNSKDHMVNAVVQEITAPCVLMEIDADELWTTTQIENVVKYFKRYNDVTSMQFQCSYFVGKNLILKGEHCYGDMDYEWWRAWRYEPGLRFISHEPPVLDRGTLGYKVFKHEHCIGRFDHMAYATEAQVKYKEKFYGYDGLLEGWKRLQAQETFPVPLRDFFPHVKDNAMVVRLYEKSA